jgi:hypothetical protein
MPTAARFPPRSLGCPTYVFPKSFRASDSFLADLAGRLPSLSDQPALLTWPTSDALLPGPIGLSEGADQHPEEVSHMSGDLVAKAGIGTVTVGRHLIPDRIHGVGDKAFERWLDRIDDACDSGRHSCRGAQSVTSRRHQATSVQAPSTQPRDRPRMPMLWLDHNRPAGALSSADHAADHTASGS